MQPGTLGAAGLHWQGTERHWCLPRGKDDGHSRAQQGLDAGAVKVQVLRMLRGSQGAGVFTVLSARRRPLQSAACAAAAPRASRASPRQQVPSAPLAMNHEGDVADGVAQDGALEAVWVLTRQVACGQRGTAGHSVLSCIAERQEQHLERFGPQHSHPWMRPRLRAHPSGSRRASRRSQPHARGRPGLQEPWKARGRYNLADKGVQQWMGQQRSPQGWGGQQPAGHTIERGQGLNRRACHR